MNISEATYNQLNELLWRSFDTNARADNFAYNMIYLDYENISYIYHHFYAHMFPEWADMVSELMNLVKARAIRQATRSYIKRYDNLIDIFHDNLIMTEEYRDCIKQTIQIAENNEDYEVVIQLEDLLLKFLPYVRQSQIWEKKAEDYKETPYNFDVHFRRLTKLIDIGKCKEQVYE